MTLLIRPELAVGEGPQGFLYRLAKANDLNLADIRNLGLQFDVMMLNKLGYFNADFMNKPAGTYALSLESNLVEKPQAWNREIPRFCSMCLKQYQYWRFEWEVLFIDACPDHEIWLQDRCQNCHEILSWQRSELFQCSCGAQLKFQTTTACPKSITELSRELSIRIFASNHITQASTISKLNLNQIQRLIRFLSAYGDAITGPKPRKVIGSNRLDISWHMTSLSAEIIDQWPHSFIDMLDRLQDRTSDMSSGKLAGRFGHFYNVLYRCFPDPEFEFLRKEFELYVADNWRGSFGRRNRRLFEKLPKQLSWIPSGHACQALGLSHRRLKDLVSKGQIVGEERISKSGRRFLVVRRQDVETEVAKCGSTLDLHTSATLLGIKKMRLALLLPILIPEARKTGGDGCPWMIPRKTIDDLLQNNQSIQEKEHLSSGEVIFAQILRHWPWSDNSIAELLLAVLTTKITPVARDINRVGVCGWIFKKERLVAWYQLTQKKKLSGLSVPEVAARLDIKQEVAYFLVRKGILQSRLVRKVRYEESRIYSSDLTSFEDNYIFGRDLAATIGTSSRFLATHLSLLDVKPVCGPGIDECRQLVFAKSPYLDEAMNSLIKHKNRYVGSAAKSNITDENNKVRRSV